MKFLTLQKVEDINKQLDALAQGMTTDDQGNAITFEKKIQGRLIYDEIGFEIIL